MNELDNILISILFVAGDPVDVSEIAGKLEVSKTKISESVKRLKEKFGKDFGLEILQFGSKLQIATNHKYADDVARVLNPIREKQLSRATLETLAIIAYKQPVTRLEIEEIRGVSSDYAIGALLEHKLIEVVGRKESIGNPFLFGTTEEFLKRFDLDTIENLPDFDELMSKIQSEREENKVENEKLFFPNEDIADE